MLQSISTSEAAQSYNQRHVGSAGGIDISEACNVFIKSFEILLFAETNIRLQGTKDIVGRAHRLVKEILSQCDDAKYEEVIRALSMQDMVCAWSQNF